MMRTAATKMVLLPATALLCLAVVTGIGHDEIERAYDGANFGNVNAEPSLVVLDELRRNYLQLGIQLNRHLRT